MRTYFLWIAIASLAWGACNRSSDNQLNADVIIYGGTSAAIITAVQVARMGKTVLVVSPDVHLGGLSSSGLGFTDIGKKEVIGGLSREFYQRVYNHYQTPEAWQWQKQEEYGNVGQGAPAIDKGKRTMWNFEPHVAEKIFEDFVQEHNITVYRDEWLDRENGVLVKNGQIRSITTLSGKTFTGKIFVDATYEGDLMAATGVSYHVGREANSVYGETWNGVQTGVLHHDHYFKKNISPYIIPGDPSSGLLPRVSSEEPGIYGEGDHRVQAYCFRLCLTRHPDNKVPFSKPEGYDPNQYELLVRVYDSGYTETFRKFDPIPNVKTDVNNHGPFSFDNIGMNYDYPEASYERRREIVKEHETYQKGLLYFMATDPRIPKDVQDKINEWGYAQDEFADNGNWPYQLYIREARRMIGAYVMTENEIMDRTEVKRSIGMGSYHIDSHNTQRYIKADGFVQNEGDIGVRPPKPYRIDLGTILPQKEECGNLLVPVAVSSSHIAYGPIRMEPVFMILGQSAATVAVLALESNIPIHEVTYARIQEQLLADGQVLEF